MPCARRGVPPSSNCHPRRSRPSASHRPRRPRRNALSHHPQRPPGEIRCLCPSKTSIVLLDSAMADESDVTEARKAYQEIANSTNRFVVSTFSILTLLTFLVGQEIRESDAQISAVKLNEAKAARELAAAEDALSQPWCVVVTCLASVHPVTSDGGQECGQGAVAPHPQAATSPALSPPLPPHAPTPARHRPRSPTSIKEASTSGPIAQAPASCGIEELEWLSLLKRDELPLRAGNLAPGQLEALQKSLERVEEQLAHESQARGKTRNGELLEALALLKPNLGAYVRSIQQAKRGSDTKIAYSRIEQQLRAAKKSIPTPFGGFDIDSKIALVGLAWATLLTYLMFLVSVRRIRFLAQSFAARHPGAQLALASPAPFWIYPLPPGLDETLRRSVDERLQCRTLSLVLHVTWIGAAAWLAFECDRWQAASAIRFDARALGLPGAQVVLFAALAIAVIAGIAINGPWPADFKPSKRRFLWVAGPSVVALALGGLTLAYRRIGRPGAHAFSPLSSRGLPTDRDLFVNPHTLVVHHSGACRRHLHSSGVVLATSAQLETGHLHRGYEIGILTAVARARATVDDSAAERLLLQAVKLSPLSLHLYDALARIYGRQRRYAEIQSILQNGLKEALQALKQLNSTALRAGAAVAVDSEATRAVTAFQARLHKSAKESSNAV